MFGPIGRGIGYGYAGARQVVTLGYGPISRGVDRVRVPILGAAVRLAHVTGTLGAYAGIAVGIFAGYNASSYPDGKEKGLNITTNLASKFEDELGWPVMSLTNMKRSSNGMQWTRRITKGLTGVYAAEAGSWVGGAIGQFAKQMSDTYGTNIQEWFTKEYQEYATNASPARPGIRAVAQGDLQKTWDVAVKNDTKPTIG